jgi:hypothetical protein
MLHAHPTLQKNLAAAKARSPSPKRKAREESSSKSDLKSDSKSETQQLWRELPKEQQKRSAKSSAAGKPEELPMWATVNNDATNAKVGITDPNILSAVNPASLSAALREPMSSSGIVEPTSDATSAAQAGVGLVGYKRAMQEGSLKGISNFEPTSDATSAAQAHHGLVGNVGEAPNVPSTPIAAVAPATASFGGNDTSSIVSKGTSTGGVLHASKEPGLANSEYKAKTSTMYQKEMAKKMKIDSTTQRSFEE